MARVQDGHTLKTPGQATRMAPGPQQLWRSRHHWQSGHHAPGRCALNQPGTAPRQPASPIRRGHHGQNRVAIQDGPLTAAGIVSQS